MHHKSKLFLVVAVLSAFSIAWSQPGAEDVQTRTAKEVKESKKKLTDEEKFVLDNQDIFGDNMLSPWLWQPKMEEEDIAINIDRDFSEYLVATLDRERVESSNQEN